MGEPRFKVIGTPLGVAVVSVLVAALVCIRLLSTVDWDPTIFATFGELSSETPYAEEVLGREVVTRPRDGHDGKYFFVQANDPLILEPSENAVVMNRATYRSQRMLFPLIAGGGSLFPPAAIPWTLLMVNLAALGLGSWAVAKIALVHGAPTWAGFGFGLNPGILSELLVDGAGVVAFALACLGALALEKGKTRQAVIWFVASCLTREVMLIFVGSIWLFWWLRRKERRWSLVLPGLAAVLIWALYVRQRLGADVSSVEVQEITFTPFSGLVRALTTGLAKPLDLVFIGVTLAVMAVVLYRAVRSPVVLTWGAVGFVALAPFLTVFVWQKYFDISRALVPVTTVFVLEIALSRQRRAAMAAGAPANTS